MTGIICLAATAVMGGDIAVTVPGPDGLKTVSLTTNSVSLVRLNWDGLAGGGEWNITGSIEGEKVVLIEKSVAADNGSVSESMSKHTIPTNKVPRVVTFGQTTVTVFRVEQKIAVKQSPSQAPEDTPRKLAETAAHTTWQSEHPEAMKKYETLRKWKEEHPEVMKAFKEFNLRYAVLVKTQEGRKEALGWFRANRRLWEGTPLEAETLQEIKRLETEGQ